MYQTNHLLFNILNPVIKQNKKTITFFPVTFLPVTFFYLELVSRGQRLNVRRINCPYEGNVWSPPNRPTSIPRKRVASISDSCRCVAGNLSLTSLDKVLARCLLYLSIRSHYQMI